MGENGEKEKIREKIFAKKRKGNARASHYYYHGDMRL
jgi:hypothetical protein